jgi:hypothetical protein
MNFIAKPRGSTMEHPGTGDYDRLLRRTARREANSMSANEFFPLEGGCTCRSVRYELATKPLFVHCCHCRWCQRETGSAFALNAMIEAEHVHVLQGSP